MMKSITRIFVAAIGFGLVLGYAPSMCAQETEGEEFTLEEITVTAQKREEDQQKVPIAMDVISGEEMMELGNTDLDEIITRISTVFINEAGDGMRVSIRGISSDETHRGDLYTISNSMPVVAVNTDGVFTAGRKSGANMYDLERVEVLFGPQSTLYASNSPGGIVNVVTGSPKTDKYEMSGKIEYGSYNTLQTEGMVNVPMSERTALRAAFMTSSHAAYMANGSDDDNTKSVRGKLLFEPNDNFSITFTGQYLLDQGMGIAGIDMFIDQDDVDDPWDNSYMAPPVPRDRKTMDYNIQITWDLGFGTLTVLPAYSTMKETATITGMRDMFTGEEYTSSMDNEQEEKGAEARMISSEDFSFKWILGGNIYRFYQHGLGKTVGTPYWMGTHNRIKSWALYGSVTYPFTDQFRATGGLRYSDDWNEGHFGGLRSTGYEDRLSFLYYDGFDHKIGFEYDVGENSMLYADWSTGYRVGSMGGAEKDPETLNAYTVGSKNRFFGNRLQVNWSAYYYDYKNYPAENHMDDPVTHMPDQGGETDGDMRMIGSDLQTDTILSSQDRLSLSISYENAEFEQLVFEYYSPSLPDIVYNGKSPTFTPEWTVNAVYEHTFNLANGGAITASIDSRYQSAMLVNFMESAAVMVGGPPPIQMNLIGYRDQEAYHLSNVSMTYASPDGKWTLAGYIKNLENYAVKKNLMFGTLMIGPPRTYGLVLSVKY